MFLMSCWMKIAKYYCTCIKQKLWIILSRAWASPRHCTNPALILKLSLKKTAKGTISPFQNLGGKLRRKHTRRDTVQYKNYKLKCRPWEEIYCLCTFQSRSTEHVRLMHNQPWQIWELKCHNENVFIQIIDTCSLEARLNQRKKYRRLTVY